jgi:short-subunit dehydrogenase
MTDKERAAPGLALITGATSGIGRVFAERLAADGHDLVLVARDAARLDEVARKISARHGVRAEPLRADLASDDGTTRIVERIAAGPPLDLLVNNAGFGTKGALADADAAEQEGMLRVHVMAPMRLTQAALPAMLARGRGAIVNVSSVASFLASPGNVNYCATKAYLRVFSEGLALEVARRGIVVQALCPGFTHTEFHDRMQTSKSHIPSWMWMSADRVVADSLAAVRRGGPVVVIPGARYKMIVAALRHAPRWLIRRGTGRYRRDEART